MTNRIRRYPLIAYVIISYAVTWLVLAPELLAVRGLVDLHLPRHWESIAAFGPAIAGFTVAYICNGRQGVADIVHSLLHWRVGAPWWLFVVLMPALFFIAAIAIVAVQQGAAPDIGSLADSELASAAGLVDLVLFGAVIQSLAEEPGWRGFYLSRLRQQYRALAATLILSPVWILWHVPFFLLRPEFGIGQFIGLATGLFAAAIWFTFIFDGTRSVLMAFLFHVLINIARGMALAVSKAMFLAIAIPVIVGAFIIVLYWLIYRPASTATYAAADHGVKAPN